MLNSFSRFIRSFFIVLFIGNLLASSAFAGIGGKNSNVEDVLLGLQIKHQTQNETFTQQKLQILKQKWESKHLSKIAPAQPIVEATSVPSPTLTIPAEPKPPVEIPVSPNLGDEQATEPSTSAILSSNLPAANVDSVTPPPVEPAPLSQAVAATDGGLLKDISPIKAVYPPSSPSSFAQSSPFSLTLARLESKREKRNQEAKQLNIVLPSQGHGFEQASPSLAKLNQALKQIISRNPDPNFA